MSLMLQETVLTGSSDGLIRLCSIFPNKLLGVWGSHDDFPVEVMKVRTLIPPIRYLLFYVLVREKRESAKLCRLVRQASGEDVCLTGWLPLVQISHDRRLLASIAHDDVVRFWDIRWVPALWRQP
jgi:WD40 repeat protein